MKYAFILRSLMTALAALAGVHFVLAQPTFSIAPAGNQSVLYWPTTPTNYLLQSATDLTSPNWVYANDAVAVTATLVSNTLPVRFFRLIYTNPPEGMALIPAGSFTIGDTVDGNIADAVPTNVYVSAFYMDTNLVSSNQWATVRAYAISHGYGFDDAGEAKAANHPVQTVNWYDVVKWCNARSEMTGLVPAYFTDGTQTTVYRTGDLDLTSDCVNWTGGYRLPTEAEWEKAARGGLSGRRFPWGNRIDENQANYVGHTDNYSYDLGPNGYNTTGTYAIIGVGTTPVGSFDANGYGLYDMAGNVFEWCWDWYALTPYPTGSPYLGGFDPHGPSMGNISVNIRVLRGGSWYQGLASGARCEFRSGYVPWGSLNSFGFRCVRGL